MKIKTKISSVKIYRHFIYIFQKKTLVQISGINKIKIQNFFIISVFKWLFEKKKKKKPL